MRGWCLCGVVVLQGRKRAVVAGVHSARLCGELRLAHAVADLFAATSVPFLAVVGAIVLDFDEQIRVGESNAVARGGHEHVGIS